MTHLAELEPRRRRHWLIAVPLAIVIALGVAWTALWFYAAGEAETRLNDWQEQQAQGGRVFTCASRSVGGYPFRIEVTLRRRGGRTERRAAADRDQAEADPRGRAGVGSRS